MTKEQMKNLKAGRPGSKVLVKGTVRTLDEKARLIEVQFPSYSLWIPIESVLLVKVPK